MQLPTPGFLLTAFLQVCRRFPGPMISTFLATAACFLLIDSTGAREDADLVVRTWMTSQLGLPFLTALIAYSESKNWSENRAWLIQLFGIAALVGCWFWLDNKAENFETQILPQYVALFLVLHLSVAFAPYLNWRSVRNFWEYNRQLFANIVVGAAFTLILFAGLALAILAVDNLFDTHVPDRVYPKLFVLLAGIFNTAFFLFHFPEKYSLDTSEGGYNLIFRNLCKFILIPIVLLYFVILYAYGAKIGIQWSLPKGWVGSLILGFSVAGIFTYLLNFYLAEEDNSWIVKNFKRWFWWVLLPLTGLLFIAIVRRISDYGVTELRFLVADLGIWLAAACLYFLFSKNDNIKFIPISLALFALVWAFGPLNAFSVSERSQKGRLTEILERSGRFENGKIKPGTTLLTEPEYDQVNAALIYLENRKALSDLLPNPLDSALLEHGVLMSWLKIESDSTKESKHLSINQETDDEPIEIHGYDLAYKLELNAGAAYERSQPGNYFTLSENGKMLQWHQWKDGKLNLVEVYSLTPTIEKWWENQQAKESYTSVSLPIQERTLNLSGHKNPIRVIVDSAEIEMKGQEKQLNFLSCWVLIQQR
jgi:hypothetical protein